MSAPTLRHAGSAIQDGKRFGNDQFRSTGTTRGCSFCGGFYSIGHGAGWTRVKKGATYFWRCSGCTADGKTKVLP